MLQTPLQLFCFTGQLQWLAAAAARICFSVVCQQVSTHELSQLHRLCWWHKGCAATGCHWQLLWCHPVLALPCVSRVCSLSWELRAHAGVCLRCSLCWLCVAATAVEVHSARSSVGIWASTLREVFICWHNSAAVPGKRLWHNILTAWALLGMRTLLIV